MDTVVLPEYQGNGVYSQLVEARYDLIRRLNLRGLVAGSLIRDYHTVAHELSAEAYVRDVIDGKRFDSNLSKQLRKGFQVHSLTPNYTIADSSCGWGVTIFWENPDYRPVRRMFALRPLPRPADRRLPATVYAIPVR